MSVYLAHRGIFRAYVGETPNEGKSPVMGLIRALLTVLQGCRIRSVFGIMDVR